MNPICAGTTSARSAHPAAAERTHRPGPNAPPVRYPGRERIRLLRLPRSPLRPPPSTESPGGRSSSGLPSLRCWGCRCFWFLTGFSRSRLRSRRFWKPGHGPRHWSSTFRSWRTPLEQHIQELEDAAPVTIELRYLIPNRDDIVEHVPYGAPVILHDPVELEGYTFLGWEDADGNPETRSTFPAFEDTVLIARYTLPLETTEHITYLSADRNGVVDVDAKVTIRDFVKILYKLLNIDLVGSGTFLDVGEKDSCYKAAATLKDIGILEGNELYPDEILRFQEMLELLERFYPAVEQIRLTDYKVRVLDGKAATASKVRVLIESSDGMDSWSTVSVSSDVMEASWMALVDSFEYKLIKDLERKFGKLM